MPRADGPTAGESAARRPLWGVGGSRGERGANSPAPLLLPAGGGVYRWVVRVMMCSRAKRTEWFAKTRRGRGGTEGGPAVTENENPERVTRPGHIRVKYANDGWSGPPLVFDIPLQREPHYRVSQRTPANLQPEVGTAAGGR